MQYRFLLFTMLFTIMFLGKEAVFAQHQQLLDSLKKVVVTTDNDSNKVVTLLQLGDLYEYTIPDTALLYYRQALRVAEETKALNLVAKCSKYLGITYYYQGAYDTSLHYYAQSLSTYKKIDVKKGIAACYTNIGLVYEEQSVNVKAIAYYLKALAMNEKMNNRKGIYSAYINIGGFYFGQEAYDDALDYFLKSLDIAKELKDKAAVADAYNNVGTVYSFLADKDQSLTYYLKSLAIKKELDDKIGISSSYLNIGVYYFEKGAYKQALSYYLDALKIAESLGFKQETTTSYINLTSLYSTLADSVASNQKERTTYFNQALYYANKANALAVQTGSISTQNHISESLMNIYTKLGQYKKATKFAALYIATKDSLLNEKQTMELARIEAKYEYQKKSEMDSIAHDNEIKVKDQAMLREKEVNRMKMITFIIVGIILLLVAMTIISLQKGRIKQNERIAQQEKELIKVNLRNVELENKSLLSELDYKHKEIVNLALHIVEKNEFLKNLQKLLHTSSNSINRKNLKKLIDQNLSIEKNREEFNANIESLNDSFFLKLQDKYPNLSKNDKRLCALLRLNLSSKEIASIQNISPNSVDVNRYRLRKKLTLDSDTDLSEFLNNFI